MTHSRTLTTHDALSYPSIMPTKSSATRGHLYEIEYQGKKIRCRDLKAMMAALKQLEGSKLLRETRSWTPEEFQSFAERLHIPQRRLLAKLLDVGPLQCAEDTALRDFLGLPDNKAFAGSLSGISKVALMFGIEPRRVYIANTIYRHSKPRRTYQITPEFAEAAARHKWPSKQDLEYR